MDAVELAASSPRVESPPSTSWSTSMCKAAAGVVSAVAAGTADSAACSVESDSSLAALPSDIVKSQHRRAVADFDFERVNEKTKRDEFIECL